MSKKNSTVWGHGVWQSQICKRPCRCCNVLNFIQYNRGALDDFKIVRRELICISKIFWLLRRMDCRERLRRAVEGCCLASE